MSRNTLARHWSPRERAQARVVLDQIISEGGEVIGLFRLCNLTGFGYKKLVDLMPLVVHETAEALPGSALLVLRHGNTYHYTITSNEDATKRAYWPVARKINTIARRLSDAVGPLRGSTDLAAVSLVDVADAMVASMRGATLDAIYSYDRQAAAASPDADVA